MTTAREVVDECASILREEESRLRHVRLRCPWALCVDKEQDYWRGQTLAVIRALAAAGCTDKMRAAWYERGHTGKNMEPADDLRAMLTALADEAEHGRAGE